MISSWHSYGSIFNLGHRAIQDLLKGDVLVEEKIDGSQFSFGKFEEQVGVPTAIPNFLEVATESVIKVRSKGAVMHPDAPEKMFTAAVDTVKRLADQLHVGWTYRAEYLAKPRHNALAYDRVPNGHVIIFDINSGEEEFLSYEAKKQEAQRLGLEVVSLLYEGTLTDIAEFRQFLETTSILGGQKIEGVVIKPSTYNLYGRDKKVLMGKFVSEAYKEVHSSSWKADNPTNKDIMALVAAKYTTPARWAKAAQHLREAGLLAEDVTDIGKIMKEVPLDVLKECEEEIKDILFGYAWPHIRRSLTRGLPEWWKEFLLKRAFESEEVSDDIRVQIETK
jgi:hypothetical protein